MQEIEDDLVHFLVNFFFLARAAKTSWFGQILWIICSSTMLVEEHRSISQLLAEK